MAKYRLKDFIMDKEFSLDEDIAHSFELDRETCERISNFIIKKLPNFIIKDKYRNAAREFGIASTLQGYGLIGFEKIVENWKKWEKIYAERGFKPIDAITLSKKGYQGDSIDNFIGEKIVKGEKPKFYAPTYQPVKYVTKTLSFKVN